MFCIPQWQLLHLLGYKLFRSTKNHRRCRVRLRQTKSLLLSSSEVRYFFSACDEKWAKRCWKVKVSDQTVVLLSASCPISKRDSCPDTSTQSRERVATSFLTAQDQWVQRKWMLFWLSCDRTKAKVLFSVHHAGHHLQYYYFL